MANIFSRNIKNVLSSTLSSTTSVMHTGSFFVMIFNHQPLALASLLEDIQSHQIYVHVGYSVYILEFMWTSVVCVTAYKSQEF